LELANTIRLSVCDLGACPGAHALRSHGSHENIRIVADCRSDVNMVCCQYAETTESKNDSAHGTRQASNCTPAGLLCSVIEQRSDSVCAQAGTTSNRAAVHPSQAPIRNAPYIPVTEARGFTARFDNRSVVASTCSINRHSTGCQGNNRKDVSCHLSQSYSPRSSILPSAASTVHARTTAPIVVL
jgi:hypothetical protein